ncbi:MAG: flavodoxin family protein [Desulfobulbaceae bacterium]|nr:flavodoxin family protein [Desulfobulbaceae bacterium]
MKVLAISGSPRKSGNTETVISTMTGILEEKGYDIEFIRLNDFPLQGCQACKYCRTKGDKCLLDDGISDLLEKLKEADRVIIGAPNYMGAVSGQLKIFLDRMYSLKDSNRISRVAKGAKGVLVFAQGHSNRDAYEKSYSSVMKIVESNNIEVTDIIVAHGVEIPGEVRDKNEIMEKAAEASANL